MNGEVRLRVYNKQRYDIGVRTVNGQGINIKQGSFGVFSVNDILYIESLTTPGFISSKMLIPVDENGKELELSELGIYDTGFDPVLTEEEITSALKQSVKKIEAWIENIDDIVELDHIYDVAVKMELPLNKIKVLKKKMPDKDWLGEMTPEE